MRKIIINGVEHIIDDGGQQQSEQIEAPGTSADRIMGFINSRKNGDAIKKVLSNRLNSDLHGIQDD